MVDADVLVVGCGPGGAMAARELALAGVETVVLERFTFPRDKACGDTLFASSVELLRRLGLLDHFSDAQRIVGKRCVSFTHGETATALYETDRRSNRFGLVVPRLQLDSTLCNVAKEAGARVLEGHTVVGVNGDDGTYEVVAHGPDGPVSLSAHFVVGADGVASAVRRAFPPLHDEGRVGWAIRCYVEGVEGLDPLFHVYGPLMDGGRLLAGFGWASPLGEGRVNVGVGFFRLHPDDSRVNRIALLESFLERLRGLDPRFRDAVVASSPMAGALRTSAEPPRLSEGAVSLVGDAAHLTDPVSGEGIRHALWSGMIVGKDLAIRVHRGVQRSSAWVELERQSRRRWEWSVGLLSNLRFVWNALDASLPIPRRSFDVMHDVVLEEDIQGDGWLEDGLRRGLTLERSMAEEFPLLAEFCREILFRTGGTRRARLVEAIAGPSADERRVRDLALVCELSFVRMVIDADIVEAEELHGLDARWPNSFLLAASDYLLILSFDLLAALDADLLGAFADFVERESVVGLGRARNRRRGVGTVAVALFGLSAELAGRLIGASEREVERLRKLGIRRGRRWMRSVRRGNGSRYKGRWRFSIKT